MALGKTAKHYRKNASSRKKHRASSAKAQKKKSAVKNRVESNAARKAAKKRGVNLKGKDMAHTKNGIRPKSIKANRGSKTDSSGDRRARGNKRK